MTNEQVLELDRKFTELAPVFKTLSGARLSYCIARNADRLKREAAHITTGNKFLPEFEEYERKRIELCIAHTEKDENGNPMTRKNAQGIEEFVLDPENPTVAVAFQELRTKFADAIAAQDKLFADFRSMLAEENTGLDPYMIGIADIPDNINYEVMEVLMHFIKG